MVEKTELVAPGVGRRPRGEPSGVRSSASMVRSLLVREALKT